MTNEIIKVNAEEFGIEDNKAKIISDMFKPMLDKMVELENEYNELIKLEPDEENCKKFKELRLKYVKVRTGTAEIHKEQKQYFLQAGRFVDGWKNAQLMASEGKEKSLKEKEDYFINLEKERKAQLHELRAQELIKYEVSVIPDNLGNMEDEVWNNYITGTKANYEMRKEAERKSELERIEQENKAKLEQERRYKTSRLVDYIPNYENIVFAELTDNQYMDVVNTAIKAREEYEKEQEKIRVENEKLKQEALKREEQERKEREAYEAKLKLEREEKQKLIDAEKERIEKLKQEEKKRIEEIKRAEKAPEKEKALIYINSLLSLEKPNIKDNNINTILVCVDTMLNNAIKDINNQ